MKISKKPIQHKALPRHALTAKTPTEQGKLLEGREETIRGEVSDNHSEENYEPTGEATLDLSARHELTFRERKHMTKLSPKSATNDPPLSSKVESCLSSSTQPAKNADRRSVASTTEAGKIPMTVNASKNLFDAVDQEFREQPTQLRTADAHNGSGQFHPLVNSNSHSRKAGLTLVRASETRIERPELNRPASHSMYDNQLRPRMTINKGTSEQNMRKNQAYFGGSQNISHECHQGPSNSPTTAAAEAFGAIYSYPRSD